jgi:hypothetical protein
MSIAILPRNGSYLGWAPSETGSSVTAQRLRDMFDDVLSSETSVVLGERYRALTEAFHEASVGNWDGYGALPADDVTFAKALAVLRALPTGIPDPDIGVDPSGHISFEWYLGPRRVFTMSVDRDGDLSYAVLVGGEKAHGSAHFNEEIPPQVGWILGQFLAAKG